jgi:hypothetical protein
VTHSGTAARNADRARRGGAHADRGAAEPLFSLVERGQFLADLFCRLNVVCVDVQKGVLLHDP